MSAGSRVAPHPRHRPRASPRGSEGAMMKAAQESGQPKPSKLDQDIKERIAQVTGGRIHDLEVELTDDRLVIRGICASYYVKQLALQAVLDVVGDPAAINLEFNVEVEAHPPKAGERTD